MDQVFFEQKTVEIRDTVEAFLQQQKKIFVGSSFQTHSIPLLHIVRSISKDIPVYFIDTGSGYLKQS